MNDAQPTMPPILEELFAVVLVGDGVGRDLRWDRSSRSWWSEHPWTAGFRPQDSQRTFASEDEEIRVRSFTPSNDDIAKATALAEEFVSSHYFCMWCGEKALNLHVIMTDIYGDPVLRCLLRPDPLVVQSFGGNGDKKHWGNEDACSSVRGGVIWAPGDNYIQVGLNFFGEPWTTAQALDRRWCSKCAQTAWNIRTYREADLTKALGREPTRDELRHFGTACDRRKREARLLRTVLDVMEQRSRADVVSDMQAAWTPLTAEEFVRDSNF